MCLLLRCLPRCLSAAQGPYSQTSANSRFQWSRSAAARSLLFLLLRCMLRLVYLGDLGSVLLLVLATCAFAKELPSFTFFPIPNAGLLFFLSNQATHGASACV
ncbi:uncharacterized protein [Coffea arabica]|uniref:Uncharacterized protein isoform X2 n=1 Tax=Coffea arabica TaxID=13443 RepID=A0ABM4WCF7_COFAR